MNGDGGDMNQRLLDQLEDVREEYEHVRFVARVLAALGALGLVVGFGSPVAATIAYSARMDWGWGPGWLCGLGIVLGVAALAPWFFLTMDELLPKRRDLRKVERAWRDATLRGEL